MRVLFILVLLFSHIALAKESLTMLNASYDPTRELYKEINKKFIKSKPDINLKIKQSHGGSGMQTNAVIHGLRADVITLAVPYDIDVIASKGLLSKNWRELLPNDSSPYSSTIVFLVRKGNPKKIKDWDDLIKKDISVITPNPKTSGGAIWNYLSAWVYAQNKYSSNEKKAEEFIRKLYRNVPILNKSARGATITFVKRGIGDVLLSWENEAYLAIKELGRDEFDIVIPSISMLVNLPVAIVSKVTEAKGTSKIAKQYLKYLYTIEAQEILAKHYYRPINKETLRQFGHLFPKMNLVNIAKLGGWQAIKSKHFDKGGIFDSIY